MLSQLPPEGATVPLLSVVKVSNFPYAPLHCVILSPSVLISVYKTVHDGVKERNYNSQLATDN